MTQFEDISLRTLEQVQIKETSFGINGELMDILMNVKRKAKRRTFLVKLF